MNSSLARESKGMLKEGSTVSLGCSVSAPAWEVLVCACSGILANTHVLSVSETHA